MLQAKWRETNSDRNRTYQQRRCASTRYILFSDPPLTRCAIASIVCSLQSDENSDTTGRLAECRANRYGRYSVAWGVGVSCCRGWTGYEPCLYGL